MKIIITAILIIIGTIGFTKTVDAQKKNKAKVTKELDGPVFQFEHGSVYDFKEMAKGPIVTHVFEFTNTGNMPLFIHNIISRSRCITAVWQDTEPITPGMKGHIRVTLNTNEVDGAFYKEIYIISNALSPNGEEQQYTLFLQGTVRKI